ncbi:transposase, partial [Micromonospora chersina]|uniref:IS110 family transposase n=1 Tax=Micromonospora chersina TaxID=47854 RepID=UPI0037891F30
ATGINDCATAHKPSGAQVWIISPTTSATKRRSSPKPQPHQLRHPLSKDHLALLRWASKHDADRVWALEDCRNMTRRLEQDLLAAGERIVRVPPKLMAHMRDAARTYGKSDPIDALAVARAALREDDLPVAHLDGPDRDVRLLVDHREDLIAERTRAVNRLRWHLHELDADWDPGPAPWTASATSTASTSASPLCPASSPVSPPRSPSDAVS